jgi:hypothetical protein
MLGGEVTANRYGGNSAEHGRKIQTYVDCGGSSVCKHNKKIFTRNVEAICEHGRRKFSYKEFWRKWHLMRHSRQNVKECGGDFYLSIAS